MKLEIRLRVSDGEYINIPAEEPSPGLRIIQVPEDIHYPGMPWILLTHDSFVLGDFLCVHRARRAAQQISTMTDWSRKAITTANVLGLEGRDKILGIINDSNAGETCCGR